MKKIVLILILALASVFGFSQATTFIGTNNNYVEVRNLLRIKGLIPQATSSNFLKIDPATGNVILAVPGVSGGSSLSSTDDLPEGATNKYYSNARVQTFADTRYSQLTHNHTLDGLSNVNTSGKGVGNILQWNGSSWVAFTPPWITGNQNITVTGDVQGSGSTSLNLTLSAGVVINNKLANVPTQTFKGRASSGTGSPEDLTVNQTKTILNIDQVDNTSDISKPISTAVQNALDLKATINSPTFTGIPTAPTAPNGTNTNQIATTAFVLANAGSSTGGYTLPIASNSTLGGIKIGTGINIDLSGLASVSFPVQSWNGRTGAIVPQSGDYTFSQISSKPTTKAGYGITDVLSTSESDARYALSGHAHSASDITSGVLSPARLASGTPSNTTYVRGDGIYASLSESSIPNLVSDLAAKAPINNPTFTGTVTLPVVTNASLNSDTLALFSFGGGSAILGDTTIFSTSTIYGSVYHSGSDTIIITRVNVVLQGVSPNVTIDLQYSSSFNSGGTSIITGGSNVTSTAGVNLTPTNGEARIPPGRYIWCKTPTLVNGSKPTYMAVTLMGYKKRKGT